MRPDVPACQLQNRGSRLSHPSRTGTVEQQDGPARDQAPRGLGLMPRLRAHGAESCAAAALLTALRCDRMALSVSDSQRQQSCQLSRSQSY